MMMMMMTTMMMMSKGSDGDGLEYREERRIALFDHVEVVICNQGMRIRFSRKGIR